MRGPASTLPIDPGWLYVLAGLALCATGVLVPAGIKLDALRAQRQELVEEKAYGDARIRAHEVFVEQLERGDPGLVRRLAASQLNLRPADTTPVLMAASRTATVTDWIDETVDDQRRPLPARPETLLGRLTGGRYRLWILGGGIVLVFMGLLMDGRRQPVNRLAELVVPCKFVGRIPGGKTHPPRKRRVVTFEEGVPQGVPLDDPDPEPFLQRSVEDCDATELNPWFDE